MKPIWEIAGYNQDVKHKRQKRIPPDISCFHFTCIFTVLRGFFLQLFYIFQFNVLP